MRLVWLGDSINRPQISAVIGTADLAMQVEMITSTEVDGEGGNFAATKQIKTMTKEDSKENDREDCPEEYIDAQKELVPVHLKTLFVDSAKGKTTEEIKAIVELLRKNEGIFSKHDLDLGRTTLTEHIIDTGEAIPMKQRSRPVPLAYTTEYQEAVQTFFDQGTAHPSTSPWASPLVFVRKNNGQIRPCVDYRQLNKVTKKDPFPIPRTRDCLDTVSDEK